MKTGIELIADERKRQVEVEGWTAEHDGQHGREQLRRAAYAYIAYGETPSYAASPPSCWPWNAEWWKPKDRIRNLVKAGALIAAEIDRLQRIETAKGTPK